MSVSLSKRLDQKAILNLDLNGFQALKSERHSLCKTKKNQKDHKRVPKKVMNKDKERSSGSCTKIGLLDLA